MLTSATSNISPPLATNFCEILENFGHSFFRPLLPFHSLVQYGTGIAKCHEAKLTKFLHVRVPGETAIGTAVILTETKQDKRSIC